MNIKLIVAYDGTHYLGWQKTKMGPSIEESLETALRRILQENTRLQAASRTDAGVHAEGQVVNFFSQKKNLNFKRLLKSLNDLLPKDISVLSIEPVLENFHPTLDCTGKEYHYQICNSPTQLPFFRHLSWHFPYPLDIEKMQEAALSFLGEHDFAAFTNVRIPRYENTTRKIDRLDILPLPDNRFKIVITGNHFLYKMVRNITGSLVYAGCGKLSEKEIPKILKSKDRTLAGITAPAHGLLLKQVFY